MRKRAANVVASASPSDDGARQPPLRALIDALAVLEGCCGADDRTAAYAVAGAARAYVDSLPAASAEIESLKADLYVSRKHAADLQTELTLLEQTVQPPVSDSLRDLIDHPVTQDSPTDLEMFDWLETALYGKTGNTWEVGHMKAVMDVLRRIKASVPSSPAGR